MNNFRQPTLKQLTVPVLWSSFLSVPLNSANEPDKTRTVAPGTRSLSSFSVARSLASASEAFLDRFFDLGATLTSLEFTSELLSSCSALRILSRSCSSSQALSVFSCSSFACRNIASKSSADTGLGLLICFLLK